MGGAHVCTCTFLGTVPCESGLLAVSGVEAEQWRGEGKLAGGAPGPRLSARLSGWSLDGAVIAPAWVMGWVSRIPALQGLEG